MIFVVDHVPKTEDLRPCALVASASLHSHS
jgi:hypothetical protein